MIELPLLDNSPIFVNPAHVVAVQDNMNFPGCSLVQLQNDSGSWNVRGDAATVAAKLSAGQHD